MPKKPGAPMKGGAVTEPYKQYKSRTGTTLPKQTSGGVVIKAPKKP